MKKAIQLFKILSNNHTEPLAEKYAKVVLQVATLEEKINSMMNLGMIDKAKELKITLVELLEIVKKEFIDEKK